MSQWLDAVARLLHTREAEIFQLSAPKSYPGSRQRPQSGHLLWLRRLTPGVGQFQTEGAEAGLTTFSLWDLLMMARAG